jgi:predicted metal-dependent HD superfamily phosphohydrolase
MTSRVEAREMMADVPSETRTGDDLRRRLPDRWARLLPEHPDLGHRLIERYADPSRSYHDDLHLARVLVAVDELADAADHLDAVQLAAWYHDAVYDVRCADNEDQSARLAETELAAVGVDPSVVSLVARLVRLTATHAVEPGDRDGAVLCDADLAILAAPPDDYSVYAAGVRAEFAHVPEPDFRAGRAAILRQLLELPHLFATTEGRKRWEAAARANVEREIAALSTAAP